MIRRPVLDLARRFGCLCILAATATRIPAAGPVINDRSVQTAFYRATVDANGGLSRLDPARVDFLRGAAIGDQPANGICLWSPSTGPISLTSIAQTAPNQLTARGEKVSLRYAFAEDRLTLTAENGTAAPVFIRAVFESRVGLAVDPDGVIHKIPVEAEWSSVTLAAGATGLKASGGGPLRLAGLGPDNAVLLAEVPAGAARALDLQVERVALAADERTLTMLGAPPLRLPEIELYSPLDRQVVQRLLVDAGRVRVSGRLHGEATVVQARLSLREKPAESADSQWRELSLDGASRCFEGQLLTPAGGWYRLEVRAMNGGRVTTTTVVEHVGVGEVFVVAGQSNSTNYGADGPEKLRSGMASTFDGERWRIADDPQPGTHDRSRNGSPWPAFADLMYEKYKVPIGLAVTGHGGASVDQWAPGDELFEWMMTRVRAFGPGGFRALLWHQGETDVEKMSEEYRIKLARIVLASNERDGWAFPWFVARVSYLSPDRPSFDSTRDAQKALWDAGIALEGPDTDSLTGDNRDRDGEGIHLSSKGLKKHGEMWAEKVGVWLDGQLAQNR